MSKIRVTLVDDHAIVRAGLRLLIETQSDMEVVGEAGGSRAALNKVSETKPDVTTIDIRMSGTSGIKTIEHLLHVCPGTRILVITVYDDPVYARSSLLAGALGYISKHTSASSLLTAIRSVYEGRCYVDPRLVGPLLQDFLQKKAARPTTPIGGRGILSRRECEVLILLAQGYTNRQIADQIGLSVKTVESYRARVVDKLELHSRADLIRYAHESGLLTPYKVL
jgi:DNA-binding NarL/FixJ family response regulator